MVRFIASAVSSTLPRQTATSDTLMFPRFFPVIMIGGSMLFVKLCIKWLDSTNLADYDVTINLLLFDIGFLQIATACLFLPPHQHCWSSDVNDFGLLKTSNNFQILMSIWLMYRVTLHPKMYIDRLWAFWTMAISLPILTAIFQVDLG